VINLKHDEMQSLNCVKIFNAICKGQSTISDLSSYLGIGHSTINNICNKLISLNFIVCEPQESPNAGRRRFKYLLTRENYCSYIYENDECFKVYSLNVVGEIIDLFNVYKYSLNVPIKDTLSKVKSKLMDNELYSKYCRGIYINCPDETDEYLPDEFIKFDFKPFSIRAITEKDKISLLAFDECNTLCINERVIDTESSVDEIIKVFGENNITVYSGNFNIFNAARRKIILKNMIDLL
jgi:predicted transcriptional regulator